MPSFWVEPADVTDGRFVLRAAEAHHLVRVRRVRRGDQIRAVDGQGTSYLATVLDPGPEGVECRIEACCPEWGESPVRLCLAAALVKGQRFDLVVEKATEIGVDSIRPVLAVRGVASQGSEHRAERWQRLARAAAKQCDRSRVPVLHPPAPLPQVLAALAAQTCRILLASPEAPPRSLRQLLAFAPDGRSTPAPKGASAGEPQPPLAGEPQDWPATALGRRLALLVGPEGGFTAEERACAVRAGGVTFSWGTRVLRAETACLALAALVLYEAEQAA
jgi:16S rRNA (uracil1498-N3)-methyltransferase